MRLGATIDGLIFIVNCAITGFAIGAAGGVLYKLTKELDQASTPENDPEFQRDFNKFMANVDPGPPMSYYCEQLEKLPFGAVLEIPGAPFDLVRGA